MAVRISNPIHQHFTKGSITRAPLSRGQLFFYEPGTTTYKTVYSDQDASTAYSDNPIALDDNGFEPDIFGGGSYRVILRSSVDTSSRIQFDEEVVFSSDEDAFGPWLDTKTYGAGGENIVTGPDGLYYISIQASNLDNIPSATATYWTEFDLLKQWNTNETYLDTVPVTYSGGFYTSLASSNLGNTPDTSPASWSRRTPKVTIQKFTSSDTWTKPSGVTQITVECIGGGGGSGSSAGGPSGAGGGGGYARIVLDASGLTSETVTIGAGGPGGVNNHPTHNDGTAGGTTSFGSLCVATGGGGGEQQDGSGATLVASGGIGTTGDMLAAGRSPAAPIYTNDWTPAGGGSAFGGGGIGVRGSGTDGVAGRNYGGGGGSPDGSASAGAGDGAAGAAGFVIITEFS